MGAPKRKKVAEFQPSRDSNRIIPCKGGFAYISDQFGRTRHLKIDSDEFATTCISTDEYFEGKVLKELAFLGWSHVIENMERLSSEILENSEPIS
jgi:hypothetical protein